MLEVLQTYFASPAVKWIWAIVVAIATVAAPIYSSFIAPAVKAASERRKNGENGKKKTRVLKKGDLIVTLIPLNRPRGVYQGFGKDNNVDIGSKEPCDLVLGFDDAISSRHCCISARDGRFFIKDYNSTNGTYLNGKKIDAVTEIVPDDDTVLKLGETEFSVNILAYKDQS